MVSCASSHMVKLRRAQRIERERVGVPALEARVPTLCSAITDLDYPIMRVAAETSSPDALAVTTLLGLCHSMLSDDDIACDDFTLVPFEGGATRVASIAVEQDRGMCGRRSVSDCRELRRPFFHAELGGRTTNKDLAQLIEHHRSPIRRSRRQSIESRNGMQPMTRSKRMSSCLASWGAVSHFASVETFARRVLPANTRDSAVASNRFCACYPSWPSNYYRHWPVRKQRTKL